MFDAPLLKGLRCVAILGIGALLVSFVLVVVDLADEPLQEQVDLAAAPAPAPVAAARKPFAFASNADCRPCHREIWDECAADQHAQAWFNQPLLPQDPRRTECNNCHAPEPILETGIEELAVIRTARFEEGVGCIECHRNVDHVEGPLPGADAPCNPLENAAFVTSNVCNACHAPHGSFAEWKASAWAERGMTCQGCHMPLVERPSATGGPVRTVRSHRMRTQRDPTLLREAMSLAVARDGGALVVTLTNTGAGHSIPGEISNREVFVATRLADADGRELAVHRESLKAVRREQRSTESSTQLQAGAARTWRYPLPESPGSAVVTVGYKSFYLMPDEAAVEVHAETLAF